MKIKMPKGRLLIPEKYGWGIHGELGREEVKCETTGVIAVNSVQGKYLFK